MYLVAQSRLPVVINFLQPSKPDQNMLHLTLYHRRNVEIPQKQANFTARLKIPHSTENCRYRESSTDSKTYRVGH